MITRSIQSAALALAVLAGSVGLAAAQSTPNGSTATPGSTAGSGGGNGATGSGAAPSGK